MDSKQPNNPQLARERAVYDYLAALESGDIDGIIESLQQAVHDAPLDQMIVDAHQAYFQDEQTQQNELADADTRVDLPALTPPPRRNQKRVQSRRLPWWTRTLAAVLLVGVLIGSFVVLLALRRGAMNTASQTGTATPTSLSCYPLKQFSNPVSNSGAPDLLAVTAISETDAWAVGMIAETGGNPEKYKTLIEHWNGKSWQIVSSPNSANTINELRSVAALSAADVWAVGYSAPSFDPYIPAKTLIEHWDGHQWSIVPSPGTISGGQSLTGNDVLNAVAGIATNDVWAVGRVGSLANLSSQVLIEHWNGQSWSVVSSGELTTMKGELTSIQALSGSDVWIAGNSAQTKGETLQMLAHWNGTSWKTFLVPANGKAATSLKGVIWQMSALSTNDVWALGGDEKGLPSLAHWNGHQWRQVPGLHLPAAPTQAFLSDIVAVNDNDIWFLGGISQRGGQQVLLMHWNGATWQQIKTPSLQVSSGNVEAIPGGMTIYAGRQMWIVGGVENSAGQSASALIEGQLTCP